MHIKRFEAPTMLEAVRKVKQELGPDALVLSTRTLRKPGGRFGVFGRSVVEVTAAVDREVRRGPTSEEGRRVRSDRSWRELQLTRALVDPLEGEIRELRRVVANLSPPGTGIEELAHELGEMRRVTADLVRRCSLPGEVDCAGARLSGRLLASGVSSRHAFALGEEAARAGGDGSQKGEEVLRRILASRLDSRLAPPRPDHSARVALFVGPTGVGKTTTLAKIAAREQNQNGDVSLVTTDTFRIGAEEQLRTFAGLLDVPFDVAVSAEDLVDRVSRMRGRRILVDTAGRSRRDPEIVGDLRHFRERLGSHVQVHLVLSATTKDSDLNREVERYRSLRPDSLIVTKVDESDELGNVANLLLDEASPPLAWLGTGQRVPEDLAIPEPLAMADRILGAVA